MPFVAFNKLAPCQRSEVQVLDARRGGKLAARLSDFAFWVKADGHMSRKPGHHMLLEDAFLRISLLCFDDPDPSDKGGIRGNFKTADFHLDK